MKLILASTIACSSAQYVSAKSNGAKAEKPVASQFMNQQAQATQRTITGIVKDEEGMPMIGVSVVVKGTGKGTVTDIDGRYTIKVDGSRSTLTFSYVGSVPQDIVVGDKSSIDVVLKEEKTMLTGVVVTAMGIMRKESSLTYSTQKVKAEDLTKVQDPNIANSLEGKVSGITITPNAGGAGGAAKIVLRGNKSINGNSAPLIVVDGIPMTNDTRGKRGMSGDGFEYSGMTEGADPLSMINPDDIESINVLKGANAAVLYGSKAANGVVMITTKKGREGKLDVNFTSNVTFDSPLLTPKIQNTYGAAIDQNGFLSGLNWGDKLSARADNNLVIDAPLGSNFIDKTHKVYLRNRANDDVKDFFRTGVTTNNSVSVSGGTELMRSYFSIGNSHANGMMRENSYNRNSFAFRQSYNLVKRVKLDVSLNYVETITKNRQGGGTVQNPIFHLYTTPRNIDLGYYRNNYVHNGTWWSNEQDIYKEKYFKQLQASKFEYLRAERAKLSGPLQNWAYLSQSNNNPYWLINQNKGSQREDRLFGTVSANIDIYDGLSFQARVNYTKTHFKSNSKTYATTFSPSAMYDFGRMFDNASTATEIYTDYLLNYNKQIKDYSVSASAGWVGHTLKTTYKNTDVIATYKDPLLRKLSTDVNYFETNAGGMGATTSGKSSSWDKALLFTAQAGWKETVYVDFSYRQDWYRLFRQLYQIGYAEKQSYGYFGLGANAIVSNLVKFPEWFNYMKFRVSYSEAGNSFADAGFLRVSANRRTGAVNTNNYKKFKAVPEVMKSFETGIETMFLNNRLSFDLTYYNGIMDHLYMEGHDASGVQPFTSAKVRNQGIETTIGYNFRLAKDVNWRTNYNVSYNSNKILKTAYNEQGKELIQQQIVGGTYVRYKEGGSIGDMYVHDFERDADGKIALTKSGAPKFKSSGEDKDLVYAGNMNSKWQMGWSNTFNYKDLTLSLLINGRIGGKVISLTEAYLDQRGLSQRVADARLNAERNNIVAKNYNNAPGMELNDGSGRIVPIEAYYKAMGSSDNPYNYIYSATNFRLRELSLGYTFRNLLGQNKNLNVSFIARNLFFIYNDSPVDPDVSLSTANGLGAFELFNMPSSRSFGLSMKLNF
ncbi:MAG: SusC/RagA family TonB-linked outer membrane protein [Prevotella sp.]